MKLVQETVRNRAVSCFWLLWRINILIKDYFLTESGIRSLFFLCDSLYNAKKGCRNMINFISLGTALHQGRLNKKLTQEEAAEIVDVSVETIRNIEHGYTIAQMPTVYTLWDVYDLPKDEVWEHYYRDPATDSRLQEIEKNKADQPEKSFQFV